MLAEKRNQLSGIVLDSAIEVHRYLGAGLEVLKGSLMDMINPFNNFITLCLRASVVIKRNSKCLKY